MSNTQGYIFRGTSFVMTMAQKMTKRATSAILLTIGLYASFVTGGAFTGNTNIGNAKVSNFGIIKSALAQDQQNYTCIPAIRIVADLGYCYGFTISYFEAVQNQAVLDAIADRQIEQNVATAHQQCYPTRFTSQKQLGTLAFSSYVNLANDTLLRQTSNDCRLLMDYYAGQNRIQADDE